MSERVKGNNGNRMIRFPLGINFNENGVEGIFLDFESDDFIRGNTIEDVIARAEVILALRFDECNGNLPTATSLSSVDNSKWNQVQLISIDPIAVKKATMKAVKKTLTIPSIIDIIGQRAGVNFSRVLTQSLKENFLTDKEILKTLTQEEKSLLSQIR